MATSTRHHVFAVTAGLILSGAVWLVASQDFDSAVTDVGLAPSSGSEGAAGGNRAGTEPGQSLETGVQRTVIGAGAVGAGAVGADPAARTRYRVRGRVVRLSGTPLLGAQVSSVDRRFATKTVELGKFELSIDVPVELRNLTLFVHAASHSPTAVSVDLDPAVPELDIGELRIGAGAVIVGRVVVERRVGLPSVEHPSVGVPGATVTLLPRSGQGFPRDFDWSGILAPTKTDAGGHYRFEHVTPGRVRVSASAAGRQTARSGTIDVEEDAEIQVPPIALAVGHDVSGIVLGPSDEPIEAAEVIVGNLEGQPRFAARALAAADGRFELPGMPPRSLRVFVTARGFLTKVLPRVDVTLERELVVRLRDGLRVTGVVLDARTGEPVERFAAAIRRLRELQPPELGTTRQQLERRIESGRAAVAAATDADRRSRAESVLAGLQSRLAQVEHQGRTRPFAILEDPGPAEVHAGGAFEFAGIREGIYSVSIASQDHQFIRVEPVRVQVGSPIPALQVRLETGTTLRGAVVAEADGRPVRGVTVELMRVFESSSEARRDLPGEGRRSLYPWAFAKRTVQGVTVRTARSAPDGGFEFRQVPSGRYVVSAHADSIADHESDAFVLGESGRTIELKVGARCMLHGTVREIPAALRGNVGVLVMGGHGTILTMNAASDGTYSFENLQPGSYIVRAYRADAKKYLDRIVRSIFPLHVGAVDPKNIPRRDVELVAGETRAFDVDLERPAIGIVSGTIRINGSPAVGGRAVLRPIAGEAPGSGGLSLRGVCDASGRFTIPDVPDGKYSMHLQGASRQDLFVKPIEVVAGAAADATHELAAGGLRGRVAVRDGAAPASIRGNLWVLPGAKAAPGTISEYRRTNRVHRVRVRNGVFEDGFLTHGPAILVLEIRGRQPAVSAVTVPQGRFLEIELTDGHD